jgi:hypothetical protein
MSAHLTAVGSVPANPYFELIGLTRQQEKKEGFMATPTDDGTVIVALTGPIGTVKLAPLTVTFLRLANVAGAGDIGCSNRQK